MKKPVWRLLNPNTIWYFVVMLLFAASAAVLRQYYLAGGALLATVIVFIISRAQLSRRKRELMSYVQKATDSAGISVHAGSAFPMAVIRLPDNEIIWGNPSFFAITGLSDTASYQKLEAVIPDFSNKWLSEGHSEMSGDRNIGDRRYRIYGNFVRSEDSTTTVQLATIYFADMTEMFNIRDEFMRTRPVVSIVLIDNYDELTTNLSDSAISTLDAQLNDVVANWTTGLEALCRKIERNRYLLVFESKDLQKDYVDATACIFKTWNKKKSEWMEREAYFDNEKPLPDLKKGDLVKYILQSNFIVQYEIIERGALVEEEEEAEESEAVDEEISAAEEVAETEEASKAREADRAQESRDAHVKEDVSAAPERAEESARTKETQNPGDAK